MNTHLKFEELLRKVEEANKAAKDLAYIIYSNGEVECDKNDNLCKELMSVASTEQFENYMRNLLKADDQIYGGVI